MSTSDDSRQLGRWFNWAAWIAILVVLYWFFDGALDRQQNPNRQVTSYQDGSTTVVELEQNPQGHYLATGTINHETVTFMLDTGATQVAVPGSMASRLGLSRGAQVRVRTASGITRAYRTEIDELTIGDIRLQNVAASIVPDYDSDQVLLGMSALRELEFTQRDRVLTIRQ